MITISYLSDLMPGETAFIYKVTADESCERLRELGFIDGTRVVCVARAALGGPLAYLLRGSVIALRCEDAKQVCIQRIPCASGQCADLVMRKYTV